MAAENGRCAAGDGPRERNSAAGLYRAATAGEALSEGGDPVTNGNCTRGLRS
jgi:hypothetical protein